MFFQFYLGDWCLHSSTTTISTTKAKKGMDTTVYQNYVKVLGVLIKELALEARQQAVEKDTEFSTGYMSGFHSVVSLMQQQAEAFNIPLEEIGLEGIDADEDLV